MTTIANVKPIAVTDIQNEKQIKGPDTDKKISALTPMKPQPTKASASEEKPQVANSQYVDNKKRQLCLYRIINNLC